MDKPYSTLRYNSKARWLSYWYQISETIQQNPSSVLIIGRGSGIVENAISIIAPNIKVTTLDINKNLLPDVVGDISALPFKDSTFDSILCCQVMEHIPFEMIGDILKGLSRIAKRFVIVSIPQKRKHLKLEIDTPLTGKRTVVLKYPFSKKTIRSRHHLWEINRGVSYREVMKAFKNHFNIEDTFLNEINCSHRFFILKKR